MSSINLTVDMILNFLNKNELILILNESNEKEVFSNYNDAGNEGYKIKDHIDNDICKKKIKRISCTDMGEVLLIIKEES